MNYTPTCKRPGKIRPPQPVGWPRFSCLILLRRLQWRFLGFISNPLRMNSAVILTVS